MKDAGYDGFDTWIPGDENEKKFVPYLHKHEMIFFLPGGVKLFQHN